MLPNSFRSVVCSAIFALWLFSSAGTVSAQLIYSNNFDQYPNAKRYRVSDLNVDFNFPEWDHGVSQRRVKLIDGYQSLGQQGMSLAVKYPDGKHGARATGAQWQHHFDETYNEVYLTYAFKFKRGFDFVRGGKLPGLAGGTAPTGSVTADGFNGWTARLMWRTGHQGKPGFPKQKTATLLAYTKHPTSGPKADGKDEDEDYFFDGQNPVIIHSGRWYYVTQCVRMNSVGKADGQIQVWLNGTKVLDRWGIEFRKTEELGIDQMYFSTFFGGNYDWRTSKYETAYFDDFLIWAID